MTPPAKRLLPPDSSSGAASSIRTLAPFSCAASAAHSAALPLPATITSYGTVMFFCGGNDCGETELYGVRCRAVKALIHQLGSAGAPPAFCSYLRKTLSTVASLITG